jgi:hypothetical protein
MIEDHDIRNAQNPGRLTQFLGADASEIAVRDKRGIADGAFSPAGRAEKYHAGAGVGEPRKGTATGERLVVGMRENP